MGISNQISLNRMALLYKQFIFLSGKQILIVLGSTAGLITGFHAFMYFVNQNHIGKTKISDDYHVSVFLFAFFVGCVIWCGHAFPAFRSKERSMDYLITPSSTFEKFLFEFINRILIYMIGFPIFYWIFTNLVTGIFHVYYPDYQNYKFGFDVLSSKLSGREITLAVSMALLAFTIPFTGATYFKKMPLLKTIIIVFFLLGLYIGFGFMMAEVLDIHEYRKASGRLLFINNEEDAKLVGICTTWIAHATLLTISYFKLKEKEV